MLQVYFLLAAAGGYLLGSIPFGLVITKAAGLGDIRTIGSGNIGATNVLRTGRKDLALATLLLDAGKAGIALLIARWLTEGMPQQTLIELTAGTAAFIGHCFPVWLKFKGGKGVATFFGLLFAGYWPLALLAGVIWLAIATIFRYSSLAALCAVALTPVAALIAGVPEQAAFTAAIAVLIFWLHRANIQRLLNGTEPRIGDKKSAPETASVAATAAPVVAAPTPAPAIVEQPPQPAPEPTPPAAIAPPPPPAPEPEPVPPPAVTEPEASASELEPTPEPAPLVEPKPEA